MRLIAVLFLVATLWPGSSQARDKGKSAKPGKLPHVKFLPLNVPAGYPKQEVTRVVHGRRRVMELCHERNLSKRSQMKGYLTAELSMNRDGRVKWVNVTPTGQHLEMASCIKMHFRRTRFPKPKGDKKITVEVPMLFGTVRRLKTPRAAIRKLVKRDKEAIRRCYAEERKRDPKVKVGQVRMLWTIDRHGKVRWTDVERGGETQVFQCLGRIIRGWSFPASKTEGVAEARHTFKP